MTDLNLQVEVVCHEAEGVDFEVEALEGMVEDAVEAKTVLVVAEDVATIVAAHDDMV